MQISVELPRGWPPADAVKKEIEAHLSVNPGAGAVKLTTHEGRAIETALLVALVTGGATVISAIIQAIASAASGRKAKTIRIVGRNGGEIDLPVDASSDDIERVARSVQLMQDPDIKIQ